MKNGHQFSSALIGLVIIIANPFNVLSVQAAEVVKSLSLEDRVTRLEQLLQQRNQVFVDLQYKISDIQQELGTLRGTQEEHSFSLKQLTERQRDIYRDVDTRLSEVRNQLLTLSDGSVKLATTISVTGSETEQSTPNGEQSQPPNQSSTSFQTAQVDKTFADNGIESYNKIFPMVRNKNYQQAVVAYQNFINNYPQSKFLPNAYYWLGQVYFVQGNLQQALAPFEVIMEKFPEFKKFADVLLKVANIQISEGQKLKAIELFRQIMTNYPNTSTARMAEKRLKELQSVG